MSVQSKATYTQFKRTSIFYYFSSSKLIWICCHWLKYSISARGMNDRIDWAMNEYKSTNKSSTSYFGIVTHTHWNASPSSSWILSLFIVLVLPFCIHWYWRRWVMTQVPSLGSVGYLLGTVAVPWTLWNSARRLNWTCHPFRPLER